MSESLTDKLAAYFAARPLTWIDGKELATVAGGYGWRTRVSDVRKSGLVIENRVRTVHSDGCAKLFVADLEEEARCDCRAYKVSEYRFVPAETPPTTSGHDLNDWTLR
jgi:hypothetical protein